MLLTIRALKVEKNEPRIKDQESRHFIIEMTNSFVLTLGGCPGSWFWALDSHTPKLKKGISILLIPFPYDNKIKY